MVTVRVKVKATGIIRTITRANYELTRSKYELLEAEEDAPKQEPQVKKEAAEPVEKEEQPKPNTIKGSAELPNGDVVTAELDANGIQAEPSATEQVTEKPKRGRKPNKA